MPSAGSLGEDGLIAGVIGAFTASMPASPGWLSVGPGDDAAVVDLAALVNAGDSDLGALVASTDTLVEGQDFWLHWSAAEDVGVKCAAQNFADIAAMGARPAVLLVSLALPASTDAAFADGLAAGLAQECTRAGAVVAGGDVSAASEIVVTGTALGVLAPGTRAVLRSGARPGDAVAVAGDLGHAAAGWALLEHGDTHHPPSAAPTADSGDENSRPGRSRPELDERVLAVVGALIEVQRRPRPPYAAGPAAAAAGATALIDTSDGLIRDAGRIAAASGVTIDLDDAALAPGDDLVVAAGLLVADGGPGQAFSDARDQARSWVLTGGEDHCMLATFPPSAALPAGFVRIGQVRAVPAEQEPDVLVGGAPWTADPGWRHFQGASG